MKVIKVIRFVDKDSLRGYRWEFRCFGGDDCSNCKFRFICYTERRVLTIKDEDFCKELSNCNAYSYPLCQQKARKMFLDYKCLTTNVNK